MLQNNCDSYQQRVHNSTYQAERKKPNMAETRTNDLHGYQFSFRNINQQAELTMVTVMYQYGEQMVIKVEQAAPKAKENVVTISGLEMDR